MGIQGAAIASVVTQTVSLVGIVIYARVTLPEHALFQRLWRADPQMFWQVFRLGWPIGLTALSEVGLFAASAVMMGWLGKVPLAAHGIALQITSVTFMIPLGLSQQQRNGTPKWVAVRSAGMPVTSSTAVVTAVAALVATARTVPARVGPRSWAVMRPPASKGAGAAQ